MKQLLYELDMLRKQVNDKDIAAFDKLTTVSRNNTVQAIQEYNGKNDESRINSYIISFQTFAYWLVISYFYNLLYPYYNQKQDKWTFFNQNASKIKFRKNILKYTLML